MKNIVLTLLILFVHVGVIYSQDETIEDYSYSSDRVIKKDLALPIVRTTSGGTKIIVEYDGNWTNEMKGAFEYACKIWEEAMPTTFPIKIKAVLDENTITGSLSKISYYKQTHTTDPIYDNSPYTNVSTWTQIKGTKFHEFSGQSSTHTYDLIISEDMFTEPDITLTYYNKDNYLVDNCSFALDGLSDDNLYDFVTVVLRDIAKSFGLIWTNKAVRNEQFKINIQKITPYE